MHSPHKSLPDMQPENMAFQSVACLQIPLTVPFTEQMFLTVALSNLYIFFMGQVLFGFVLVVFRWFGMLGSVMFIST